MAQTQGQRYASLSVVAWLAREEKNTAWLARQTKADPGTIGDFLNGNRWPKFATQGKIEKALGWEDGRLTALADSYVGGEIQDATHVRGADTLTEPAVSNQQVLDEVRAMRREVRELAAAQSALSERVEQLESGPESMDGADGQD